MIEDRLRPRYSGRGVRPQSLFRGQYAQTVHLYRAQYAQRTPEQQSLTPQRSPRQRKARAIINKYRKTVRYAQLYRLQSLVPSVRNDEGASEVDILQETVKYIEELEKRLLSQVQSAGLPPKLAKLEHKRSSENPPTIPLKIQDLRNLVHTSLQPALHEKLVKQRQEDQATLQKLLSEASTSSTSS
jgi:hypothetical protein